MQTEVIPDLERRVVGGLVQAAFLRNRRGGPWLPPAHLKHERVTFKGNTGANLVGTWFPHEKPRGVVVLAHPDRRYARHWFVKEGWIDFLHEHGYEALTFDFPGYGESHGPATYYHEDVLAAARLAHDWSGRLPVSVIGVSMGAFAVTNASPRLDFVRGIVLESPYPSFEAWYDLHGGGLAWRALTRVFPRTKAVVQAHKNIAEAQASRILVAMGGRDTLTPPALSEAVAQAAPADRTRIIRVEHAEHLGLFGSSEAYRRAILETL